MTRARRGRIRLYLAPAPGTGKTRRLLEHARALRAGGVDVIIGWIDTHGDPTTNELLAGSIQNMVPVKPVWPKDVPRGKRSPRGEE